MGNTEKSCLKDKEAKEYPGMEEGDPKARKGFWIITGITIIGIICLLSFAFLDSNRKTQSKNAPPIQIAVIADEDIKIFIDGKLTVTVSTSDKPAIDEEKIFFYYNSYSELQNDLRNNDLVGIVCDNPSYSGYFWPDYKWISPFNSLFSTKCTRLQTKVFVAPYKRIMHGVYQTTRDTDIIEFDVVLRPGEILFLENERVRIKNVPEYPDPNIEGI